MKLLIITLFLASCGIDPSMEKLTDTFKKAEKDIREEGKRFNKKANTFFEEAGKIINNESIRIKDNFAREGGNFSEAFKKAAKKANSDFLEEKARITDRLVGSKDKQLTKIEAENIKQDRHILQLEINIDNLYEMLDFVYGESEILGNMLADIKSELEEIQVNINELENNDEVISSKLRRLKRKINRIARNDDYCSITQTQNIIYTYFVETVTTFDCPNGQYQIYTINL